jgi:hypothetical protein
MSAAGDPSITDARRRAAPRFRIKDYDELIRRTTSFALPFPLLRCDGTTAAVTDHRR